MNRKQGVIAKRQVLNVDFLNKLREHFKDKKNIEIGEDCSILFKNVNRKISFSIDGCISLKKF